MHHAPAPAPPPSGRRLCSPEKFYGWPVEDQAGRVLGTVNHLLIDMRHGQVAYAVVASGGFLGLGEARFPLPWHALEPARDGTARFIWNGVPPADADLLASVPAALLRH